MKVVISQPMFLPWIGLFEQIRLADIFVHYDDVDMPRGRSFIQRVQIKTPGGQRWLSAEIDRQTSGTLINQIVTKDDSGWRNRHLNLLHEHYRYAPYHDMMMEIADHIYGIMDNKLAVFNQNAIEFLADWLGLSTEFHTSSSLSIAGRGTERLVKICCHYGASEYITGHGAANYLKHEKFEENGTTVAYMDYQKSPYDQLHNGFIPYVTILDAIANIGEETRNLLVSDTIPWRDYIHESYR